MFEIISKGRREKEWMKLKKDNYFKILKEKAKKIDPMFIKRLYKSLPRRLALLKKQKGNSIKY